MPTNETSTNAGSIFSKWLCGALAAGLSETITMPLDVAKTRLQLQNELCSTSSKTSTRPASLVSVIRHILSKEGVASFFTGTQAAVVRQALCGGIGVGLYQPLRTAIAGDSSVSFGAKVLCASMTGTLGQLVAAPTDVIKVRLQADARLRWQGQEPRYRGMYDAIRTIPKQEGFASFYRGLTPSLGRAAIMYGTSCAAYDHAKYLLVSSAAAGSFFAGDKNMSSHVCASLMSGFIASCVSAPFDVVKTRIMNQPAESKMYSGPIDCVMKTVRSEGVAALYKGFIPTYLRLAPWQMIFFVTAEQFSLAICGCSFTSAK
jgi:hypothetical protein